MATYLAEIVAAHRAAAAEDRRDLGALTAQALESPAPIGFAAALAKSPGLAVIAEIKRRSPSAGPLALDLDPADVARAYAAGGASCLSVLTDTHYFGGSVADLTAAKEASGLPVLRKDFTVAPADVCDARLMGADAVLLIVAALDDEELHTFSALAAQLGLDVLVEVHDAVELERATSLEVPMIGVNQRDLATFEVDEARAVGMARLLPEGVIGIAESGIKGSKDAERLAAAGYRAILVGQRVVSKRDHAAAVRELVGHRVASLGASR